MNAVSATFYGTQLGLPLFLLLLTQSDRLTPYCFYPFLAGTHNYLASIHNYFFTIRAMTTAHHGLPLGRWYCTISFFFLGFANTVGPFLLGCAPSGLRLCRAWLPSRWLCENFLKWLLLCLIFAFSFLSGWMCHGFCWLFLLVLWFDSFRLSS